MAVYKGESIKGTPIYGDRLVDIGCRVRLQSKVRIMDPRSCSWGFGSYMLGMQGPQDSSNLRFKG